MKKILIIAYRFPPNNETGALRPYSWAKYFKGLGYWPIVITRHWDGDNQSVAQVIASSTNKDINHQIYEDHEVYYLPFKGNIRTRLFFKLFNTPLRPVYKLLSLFEKLFCYLGVYQLTMYSFIFKFTLKYLRNNIDTYSVIISGAPFELFQLGYLAKKKLDIDWLADYRDPWSTRNTFKPGSGIYKIINELEVKAEKRWLSNALGLVATSDYLSHSIGHFVGKPYLTVYNGFMDEDQKLLEKVSYTQINRTLNIVYNGNLFDFQPIEVFFEGFKKFVDESPNAFITFVGAEYFKEAKERILSGLKGYEQYYQVTSRLSKEEYMHYQKNADVLLLVNSRRAKGIVASKVFDYILSPVPVLTIIDDEGAINNILNSTGQLLVCNTSAEVTSTLGNLFELKKGGEALLSYNRSKVLDYSRKNQSGKILHFIEQNKSEHSI